ncbi:hypothetical protein NDU88_001666 [Pleurodeles waltl]|uniref:Uncharacterized protein n=1 Tax=Pleurodeles waltl TaxID=8319 RepID=A0AAV7LC38_PLEWA|nr:hypothetical protein NDU88_001666 [Pleurodeles waltl]
MDVSPLYQYHWNVADRVTEAESNMYELEDTVNQLQITVTQLVITMWSLEVLIEDAKGLARTDNLLFVGFPVEEEGRKLKQFLEQRRKCFVKEAALSAFFFMERVYRALYSRTPGTPLRPIVAKILNYKYRDDILQVAKGSAAVTYEIYGIMTFPDYTNKDQIQRQSFKRVKVKLRVMDLKYTLL